MAYIGNTPAENYASFLTETFTVSATTNYTLSHAVANENDIRLVINGVVQQPGSGKAYTASNTTLTLTSATQSGDSMYAVYLGRALQTVNPPNASVGTAQLADSSVTSAKLASGAVANTPAFHVELASSQTVSDATWTKVAFDTEVIDTNSAFDLTTNDRFTVPSGEAGKYLIYGSISISGSSNSSVDIGRVAPYKNGSAVIECSFNNRTDGKTRGEHIAFSVLIDLAVSDYLEMYGNSDVTTGTPKFGGAESANVTFFGGYKIIE